MALPGALLLGVVNADSSIGYFETPIEIDAGFILEAGPDAELEKMFRFSSPCVKSGCAQWKGGQCGVIKKLMALNPAWHELHPALPSCSIRPTCRWYAQEGADACAHCTRVVTNMME